MENLLLHRLKNGIIHNYVNKRVQKIPICPFLYIKLPMVPCSLSVAAPGLGIWGGI